MDAACMTANYFEAEQGPDVARQIEELLDTWELARWSYGRVLLAGVERSDAQLARDSDYRNLLQAGIRLSRLGGARAVRSASRRLGASMSNGSPEHFERLWAGLLPDE